MKLKTEELWFVINKHMVLSNFPFVPLEIYTSFQEANKNCSDEKVCVNLLQHMELREKTIKEYGNYE